MLVTYEHPLRDLCRQNVPFRSFFLLEHADCMPVSEVLFRLKDTVQKSENLHSKTCSSLYAFGFRVCWGACSCCQAFP